MHYLPVDYLSYDACRCNTVRSALPSMRRCPAFTPVVECSLFVVTLHALSYWALTLGSYTTVNGSVCCVAWLLLGAWSCLLIRLLALLLLFGSLATRRWRRVGVSCKIMTVSQFSSILMIGYH